MHRYWSLVGRTCRLRKRRAVERYDPDLPRELDLDADLLIADFRPLQRAAFPEPRLTSRAGWSENSPDFGKNYATSSASVRESKMEDEETDVTWDTQDLCQFKEWKDDSAQYW